MSKVTSKLQVTLPKALADRFGIRPGDEIEWEPAGDIIRVVPQTAVLAPLDREQRLRNFEAATRRQAEREAQGRHRPTPHGERGWKREDLYRRGSPG